MLGSQSGGRVSHLNPESIRSLNLKVDAVYRKMEMKEPVEGIARALKVSRNYLFREIGRWEKDGRIMASVRARVEHEKEKDRRAYASE